ncbi:MAG: TonB C-terminal domain-containing protein [Gammaproteobacteria bacterium]|nr:MAG: TonB C-terminal domain-containing protein [Gammaproteobacteria bacterium]
MNTDFIKKIKLPEIAKSHPIAFWVAVVFHLILVVGLFFSNVQRWEIPKEELKKAASKSVPKAVTIDLTEIKKEKQRLVDIQKKKALKIQREEKRLRVLEDQRYQKQRKINQLKAKTKKEKKAKELAEKKRKEAEKKAKLAEKKKQEVEKKRKVETNKFKKEQSKRALTKEIQAEEDQDREIAQEDILNELKFNYINQIASRVHNQWRYQGAKDNWSCHVHILQDVDGNVQSVNVQSCVVDNSAKSKSFKNAIERAVYKASPLPPAPDKSVFDREILFHFKVN